MNDAIAYPRFRWVVMLTVVMVSMSATTMMLSVAPLVGVIAEELNVDLGTLSFGFMGIHSLCIAIGAFIAGQVMNRMGPYRLFVISLVLLGVSNCALPWLGHSYGSVLAIRIIEGLAIAPVLVAFAPVVASWFPINERGLANGLQAIAISLGMAVAVGVGPVLVEAAGDWRVGLAWLSVIPAVSLVMVLLIASSKVKPPAVSQEEAVDPALEKDYFRQALRQPGFWAGAVCYCTGVWVIQAFNDLMPGYFAVDPPVGVGFGPVLSGKLMVIVMLSGIVGSVAGGILSDRFGRRPLVLSGHLINAVFCASVMLPLVYGERALLVTALFFVGVGPQIVNSQSLAFACSLPYAIVGKTVGVWVSAGMLASSIGVMGGAAALQITGNYRVSIILVSIVAAVGLLAAFFLIMPKFKSSDAESDRRLLSDSGSMQEI